MLGHGLARVGDQGLACQAVAVPPEAGWLILLAARLPSLGREAGDASARLSLAVVDGWVTEAAMTGMALV